MARKPKVTPAKRSYKRKTALRPTDKWIVGMVHGELLKMWTHPTIYGDYDSAVKAANGLTLRYGRPFVVFAKKCVIVPSIVPLSKTEYSA